MLVRHAHRAVAVCLTSASLASAAIAQVRDSARAGTPPRVANTTRARDSLTPPITPRRAFLYSLIAPGWGQSRLDRPTAGAIYAGFEFLSIAMLTKSRYDLAVAKRRAKEVIADTYAVDGQGIPKIDSMTKKPIIADTVPNRYGTVGDDQQRSRLKARRLHYEDWVAMLFFSHLFSGADAFVSAHLWDLPAQVEFRQLPGGRTGVGARLSIGRSRVTSPR